MNRPKTKMELRTDKFLFQIVVAIIEVAMLYMHAKYWAYTLVFMSVVFALTCLPVALRAKAGLVLAARQHKLMLHTLLLSGLTGAAVLSGLSVFVTLAVLIGSFVYLRGFPLFVEMREYKPEASMTLEVVALGIVACAASWITLGNGEVLSMSESIMWFLGLAVLFSIAFGLFWVWWMISFAHSANLKVTARIKQTLHENNIKETAANVAEVRQANGGAAIAQTEREEAERNNTNEELMHAVLGKGAFVNHVGQFGMVPLYLLSGPMVLTASMYPAWVFVGAVTGRPATVKELVRGIRVV